jgi:hypothetical protein
VKTRENKNGRLGDSLRKIVVKVNDIVELVKRFRAEPQTAMREFITQVSNVVTETLKQVMDAEMDLVPRENNETARSATGTPCVPS